MYSVTMVRSGSDPRILDSMIYASMIKKEYGVYHRERLGGFGLILDAEYGCCQKINAVYGFCIATRLRKIGIETSGLRFFAYFVEPSTR